MQVAGTKASPLSVASPGEPVSDPADWRPGDPRLKAEAVVILEDREIADLVDMGRRIRKQIGDDPNKLLELPVNAFNLGAFEPKKDKIYSILKEGIGHTLLKGLPLKEIGMLEGAAIFWGIGRHFGRPVSNNADSDMIGRVQDTGKDYKDPTVRGYQTNLQIEYHCDQCSIVTLMCVRRPKAGGESRVASSVAVYNEMLARHPEFVKELMQPMYWTRHGETDPGRPNHYRSPVFNFLEGRFCGAFGLTHILKGHAQPGVPDLTERQKQALLMAEKIADELHEEFVMEPGDIQYANNFVTLHTRSKFEDWPEADRRRLMWRLWLFNDDIRPQTDYATQWREGVKLTTAKERIQLF